MRARGRRCATGRGRRRDVRGAAGRAGRVRDGWAGAGRLGGRGMAGRQAARGADDRVERMAGRTPQRTAENMPTNGGQPSRGMRKVASAGFHPLSRKPGWNPALATFLEAIFVAFAGFHPFSGIPKSHPLDSIQRFSNLDEIRHLRLFRAAPKPDCRIPKLPSTPNSIRNAHPAAPRPRSQGFAQFAACKQDLIRIAVGWEFVTVG